MKFDKLMQYQKCDAQAIKLERKLSDSEHKKVYSQMLAVVKDAKNHTAALENQAGDLLHSYNQLKNKYKENCDLLEKLTKVDLDKESAENVDKIFEKIAVISNNLNALEKKLMTVAEQVNSALNDFEQTKKRYGSARNKYNEQKAMYEKEEAEIKPQLDKVYSELKTLEKEVEPRVLAKYKSIRQDRIFPVLVPLMDKSCGGCMMELSYAAQAKLKDQGYLECEHCRRMIYTD